MKLIFGMQPYFKLFQTRFSCKIVPFSDQIELKIGARAFMMELRFKVRRVDLHNLIDYKVGLNNVALSQ
jgi:hypothetical protein